jgi:flavin reductase (DIM6/NTAB) family NADH-FMN oxidoreductase RutF
LIKECLAHLECKLLKVIDIKEADHFVIIGKVIAASYDSALGKDIVSARKKLLRHVFGSLGGIGKNKRLLGFIKPIKVSCPVYKTDEIIIKRQNHGN